MNAGGLPAQWGGAAQWRILATRFGDGGDFLAAWQAWHADPRRPRMLHYVGVAATPPDATEIVAAASAHPQLATRLAQAAYGLTPGFHRFAFEQGQVLLTLCVGEVEAVLRESEFPADAIVLADGDPPAIVKPLARRCRRGTTLSMSGGAGALQPELARCGFVIEEGATSLHARFDPHWQPKALRAAVTAPASDCIVIGAGLAGAAVAASLARRGWRVQVFDAAAQPAAGASALPAGLLAPHQSPDDNLLSRLSRAGVRTTLQACEALLAAGEWERTPVLEHRGDDARPPPAVPGLQPWTRLASTGEKALAGVEAQAWWHAQAAWIRPAALVHAWLAQPGVRFCGGLQAGGLEAHAGGWRVLGADGEELARAALVVACAAHASGPLLAGRVATHPVRGQVSWDLHRGDEALPPWPLNGNGHLLPRVPTGEGLAWFSGSTYGRADADPSVRSEDQAANLERLRTLQPRLAQQLAGRAASLRAWAGVRCTSADRRPLVGEVASGLWVSTAMGSRGLTFAALCAELIAARLHQEPLPVEQRLAQALDVGRFRCGLPGCGSPQPGNGAK